MAFNREQFEVEFDRAKAALVLFVDRSSNVLKAVCLALLERTNTASEQAAPVLVPLPLLTLQQAADYLNVSKRTLQDWIKCGEIEPRYAKGEPRFKLSELDEWTKQNPKQPKRAKVQPLLRNAAAIAQQEYNR